MSIGFNPLTGNFDLKGSSISGLIGPTGLQGVTGSQGTTGIKGDQGEKGTQGETGLIGSTGETGIRGTTGAKGDIGNTGLQGIIGPIGNTGLEGAVGATGLEGAIGNTGVRGETGISGIQGDKGEVGETGIQGIQGNTGIQGIQGNIGETGISGVTGPEGIQGSTGISGLDGEVGQQGTTGLDGVQGTTGLVGIDGPQGNTGIIGPQGETGLKGDKGNTGDQGVTGISITGSTGVDGLKGDQGVTGISGVTGIIGSTGVIGPQGETGISITGATGLQGIQGVTGVGGGGGLEDNILYASTGLGSIPSITFQGNTGIGISPMLGTYKGFILSADSGSTTWDNNLTVYETGALAIVGNRKSDVYGPEMKFQSRGDNSSKTNDTPQGKSIGAFRWEPYLAGGNKYSAEFGAIAGATGVGNIYFKTSPDTSLSTNLVERMRITSGGFVGIGMTGPSTMLDVNGGISGTTGMFSGGVRSVGDIISANNAVSNAQTVSINAAGTQTYFTPLGRFELGQGQVADQPVYIDFHGATGPADYNSRILRNAGANGTFDFVQTGTGAINFTGATGVYVSTNIKSGGSAQIGGNLAVTSHTNSSGYLAGGVTGISGTNISPYSFTVAGGIITGQTGTAGSGSSGSTGVYGTMWYDGWDTNANLTVTPASYAGVVNMSAGRLMGVTFTDNATADYLTVPTSGDYRVKAIVGGYPNWNGWVRPRVYKNGSYIAPLQSIQTITSSTYHQVILEGIVGLSENDKIDVRISTSNTGVWVQKGTIVTVELMR